MNGYFIRKNGDTTQARDYFLMTLRRSRFAKRCGRDSAQYRVNRMNMVFWLDALGGLAAVW